MTERGHLPARLSELVGSRKVLAADEERTAYRVDGRVPEAVVRPEGADEIAEIVQFAAAERLSILALGSRSKAEMGMALDRYDLALDMTGLHQVAHYDAGDLTLSVDAGIRLQELERMLKPKQQFLPLAVPWFETTTAGGAIASGIDSAMRGQYGTARDFLIGAEFVDGTGRLCKSGGRVVKNVTGYDLHKLLIGSLGTLGVITRLNFRTFPLMAASGGHAAAFLNCREALCYRGNVEQSGLPLVNLEVLSPEAVGLLCTSPRMAGAVSHLDEVVGKWLVYCSFEGNEAVVRRIAAELERRARDDSAEQSEVLGPSANERVSTLMREALEWLRRGGELSLVYRLALPEISPAVLAELTELPRSTSLHSTLLVRAAGVIYLAVFADEQDPNAQERLGRMPAGVLQTARKLQGQARLLYAPPPVKGAAAKAEVGNSHLDLEHRLKEAFDPARLFAPGRVVGGI